MSHVQPKMISPPPISLPGIAALDSVLAPVHFYGRADAGFLHVEGSTTSRRSPVMDALPGLLRSHGWGALWTDGLSVRFAIPEATAEIAPPVDACGQGAETYFERNLREGYYVHPASFDRAIAEIMHLVPRSASLNDVPGAKFGSKARLEALYYKTKTLRHRRLEMLFRLLAAWIKPERPQVPANECWGWGKHERERPRRPMQVVEYGSGPIHDTATVLSALGNFVEIVEPDTFMRDTFRVMQGLLRPIVTTRTHHADPRRPPMDDMAFWVNPYGPDILASCGQMPLFDYISASVAPGGFLVLQTDPEGGSLFADLHYDQAQWTRVVSQSLPTLEHGVNWFLPTAQEGSHLSLQVFRRHAKQ